MKVTHNYFNENNLKKIFSVWCYILGEYETNHICGLKIGFVRIFIYIYDYLTYDWLFNRKTHAEGLFYWINYYKSMLIEPITRSVSLEVRLFFCFYFIYFLFL